MVYSEPVQHCRFSFLYTAFSLFLLFYITCTILFILLLMSLSFSIYVYFFLQLISHCSLLFDEGSKGEIIYGHHKDQKPYQQRSRL
jgi:hypothetical protein